MESIKHKMDTMVKEKDAAVEKAMGFEAETADLNKAAAKFEKEVDEIQRKIAKDRNWDPLLDCIFNLPEWYCEIFQIFGHDESGRSKTIKWRVLKVDGWK